MPVPAGIGIIDTMIGFPAEDFALGCRASPLKRLSEAL